MTDTTCGCCEGTQLLTPQSIANRPGLDALAYRVGTHAAFLETMKARLSNFRFATPAGEGDASDQPQLPPPMRGLTTRAADDPAIALMDAWATVADVLTFYQERIANEGYLRTASERRSILELARLVGYAPRPGVASTVYLAYTVDENTNDPVIIPRGARVTSLPGPGETPQTFETVEEIEARAAWNVLTPRMTRPQTKASISDSQAQASCASPRVLLQGTNTNLKPNDPLLIQFGSETPVFVRVKDVRPDALADRTLVTLQSWPGCPEAAKAEADQTSPETVTADAKYQLGAIVGRYLAEEVDVRGLSRNTKMFGRTGDYLGALEQQLAEAVPYPALMEFLTDTTLPALEAERQTAETNRYTDLEPWLTGLIAELRGVTATTSSARAEVLAREFALATQPAAGTTGATAQTDPFKLLPTGLGTPPSVPPRNALALDRDLRTTFQTKADTLLDALGALRPDLRDVLPTVAANTKVAQDVAIKVFAPRVIAPLFGHNAQKRQRLVRGADDKTTETEIIGEWPIIYCGEVEQTVIKDFDQTNAGDIINELMAGTVHKDLQGAISAKGHDLTQNAQVYWNGQANQGTIDDYPFCYSLIAYESDGYQHLKVSQRTLDLTVTENSGIAYLDAAYDKILPASWVVVDTSAVDNVGARVRPTKPNGVVIAQVTASQAGLGRAEYGMSGKTTRVELSDPWISIIPGCCDESGDKNAQQRLADLDFQVIRHSMVYAQFEEVALADEPVNDPICVSAEPADPRAWIELDDLYSGLQAGRWLIVSGERTDITAPDPNGGQELVPVPGVLASELVMLAEVTQRVEETSEQLSYEYDGYGGNAPAPGEKTHTYLRLATDLAFCYRRDTVTIYGNVVKATHGETRQEVLGSGDGSKAFQAFTLKQAPLTYVAAPNPSGVESTLHVRVNEVEWHGAASLADLEPTDRSFITRTDDESKTTVVFGDGRQGARLPTALENVQAVYRSGIGQAGNVKPGQISQLVTRPLGLKAVINPQRASGGADRESRDQARRNAPLGVMALDRLVSTQDYADFARTFAGIGKASATRVSDGRRQLVHVTVAGADDIPIDKTSDLYANLVKALHVQGDPHQAIQVDVRELMLIVLSANICLLPDYQWESVAPRVRARLLDAFSFDRRELGQDVLLSEIISTIQAVEGVAYVDVDKLRGIPESSDDGTLLTPDEISRRVVEPVKDAFDNEIPEPFPRLPVQMARVVGGAIRPAQLAFLTPDVEATLVLNEVQA